MARINEKTVEKVEGIDKSLCLKMFTYQTFSTLSCFKSVSLVAASSFLHFLIYDIELILF